MFTHKKPERSAESLRLEFETEKQTMARLKKENDEINLVLGGYVAPDGHKIDIRPKGPVVLENELELREARRQNEAKIIQKRALLLSLAHKLGVDSKKALEEIG